MASSTYAENTIPLVEIGVPTYDVYSNIKISMGKGNEKKYAGQSFLPYFDSQNIELTIPAPLSGLELIYYNTPEYGGFIRPRISSINYLDYLLTTSNNTSTEEYDGDVETINFNTGDWRGDSQIDHSSAKDLTFMMPCILISSMVLFFC